MKRQFGQLHEPPSENSKDPILSPKYAMEERTDRRVMFFRRNVPEIELEIRSNVEIQSVQNMKAVIMLIKQIVSSEEELT